MVAPGENGVYFYTNRSYGVIPVTGIYELQMERGLRRPSGGAGFVLGCCSGGFVLC